MNHKNIQIHQDPKITWSTSLKMPFVIPEGYFDQFQEYLMTEIHIQNTSWSPLNPLEKPSKQYFDQLSDFVISEINMKEIVGPSKNIHNIPEGYFEEFSQKIFHKVQQQEADVSFMSSKKMPFNVPHHYFDGFTSKLLSQAIYSVEATEHEQVKTKIVPLQRKSKPQWLWAAASIALLVGFLGFKNKELLFNTSSSGLDQAYFESEIAKIPYEEIQDYLNIQDEDIELNFSSRASEEKFMNGLNKITLDDLESYLVQ